VTNGLPVPYLSPLIVPSLRLRPGAAVLLMLARRYHMAPMQRCYW